jgi:hypothetical protein
MCICVFANKITFWSKQIHIRRCAKEKTFAETENGDLFICLFVYSTTKSQPYRRQQQQAAQSKGEVKAGTRGRGY